MNIITRPPRLVALCARANVRFCALTTENLAAQQPGNVRAAMGHSSDPRLVDIQLERNIYNRNWNGRLEKLEISIDRAR